MTTYEMGRIEPVDVSELWRGEGVEFARWLSENIQQLGAPLHMDLELVRLEPPVGWFWLNVLAKEVGSENLVAVALQRDNSRHELLGSLVAYAARHDAKTLVWVTSNFRREHRETLEWLNQLTPDDVEVYGVEIRAIQIGESPPAHEFRPVAFGDALAKRGRVAASGLTPVAYRRLTFFQPLVEDLWREGFTNRTTARSSGGQSFPSGFSGISYNATFGWGKALVHIWISTGDQSKTESIYKSLLEREPTLTRKLDDLEFDLFGRLGGGRRVSAGMSRAGSLNSSDEELEGIRAWMYASLTSLKDAFQPHLETVMGELQAAEARDQDAAAEDWQGQAVEGTATTPLVYELDAGPTEETEEQPATQHPEEA